jgi:phage terminase large subunit-like protein
MTSSKNETRADKIIRFIETYCLTPEGVHVGKPIKLAGFQKDFIYDVYDNPNGTRTGVLSIARKNGKTAIIAGLLLAHTIGPERKQNSQIISGAMSREQASLVFNLASKMLLMQPHFDGLYRVIPSSKKILGLKANVEYKALSAEATTAHGLSPVLAILDEVGQVKGPGSPFIDAILSSQGAHEDPLTLMISTQAPSDADFLSIRIDDAIKSSDPHIVCHVHAADPNCDLLSREQWVKANPALGIFRMEKDLEEQLKQASRIPALESSARNLLLNQRVALETLWLAPSIWKQNSTVPDIEAFRSGAFVSLGLDLSQKNDLTAAVIAVQSDDEKVHIIPYVFTPEKGIEARELRDRAPYTSWAREGHLIPVPGAVVDYDWTFQWLKARFESLDIKIDSVVFDRWRINEARSAAERAGFVAGEWKECGQGFKDMAPRVEFFEQLLLQERLCHGAHPLMNMAASNAIAIKNPAGDRKLEKAKSTQKIDPLVAALMATGEFMVTNEVFDVAKLIG